MLSFEQGKRVQLGSTILTIYMLLVLLQRCGHFQAIRDMQNYFSVCLFLSAAFLQATNMWSSVATYCVVQSTLAVTLPKSWLSTFSDKTIFCASPLFFVLLRKAFKKSKIKILHNTMIIRWIGFYWHIKVAISWNIDLRTAARYLLNTSYYFK